MAATTTWHPRTTLNPKSWLLTNGEIVQEPPLEETASGRKVRVAGTSTSMFSKDVDDLIFQGVQHIAKTKGEQVWMLCDDAARKAAEETHYGHRLRKGVKPALHLLAAHSGYNSGVHTTAWWRFRHPTLPIEAVLIVDMSTAYSGYGRNNGPVNQDIKTALLMQSTSPLDAQNVELIHSVQPDLSEFGYRTRDAAHRLRFQEMIRDSKPNWDGEFRFRQEVVSGDRQAVKSFLTDVQNIDQFEEIDVPDLRDGNKPTWLRLELQDTNVTGEFVQSLKDYLDGGDVVAEVKKHWDEMVRLLRSAGLVLEEKDEASFRSALAGGDPVTIAVQSPPNDTGHRVDHSHSVSLHLPSGTMVVNCSNAPGVSSDEIAHKWEEAVTLASLTGQEDVLLAYAKRYRETHNDRRVEQIIGERKFS